MLPFKKKKIFLKKVTYFFGYFYIENEDFFFSRLKNFGTYVANRKAIWNFFFQDGISTSFLNIIT